MRSMVHRRRDRLGWCAGLPCALALLGSCGGDEEPSYTPPEDTWIDSDRHDFVDAAGRVRIFRGVNVRVEGIFDVTFDDGRARLEPIPDFGPEDARQIASLGFNMVRLPVNWSGIEPTRDQFDEAYLDRVEAFVALCKAEGVHVIIDFHQDAYSKEIGEDGAPYWAIVPEPEEVHEGPLTAEELEDARTSLPVVLAFLSFFVNDDDDPIDEELQAEFAEMAAHVAARFADEPYVLGYELFNEPVADDRYLVSFHDKVAAAIREVDERHLLLFEPNAIRNLKDEAPLASAPFADARGVYAPHLYTLAFSDPDGELATLQKSRLEPNFEHAERERAAWETPMLIGEWGIDPQADNAEAYTRWMYELLDARGWSAAAWLWKENSQGRWGFYDFDDATGTWSARPEVWRWHARPWARAIGGKLDSMRFDAEAEVFELRFEGREDGAPSEVVWPAGSGSVRSTCDGEPLGTHPLDPEAAVVLELRCGRAGSHAIQVTPA